MSERKKDDGGPAFPHDFDQRVDGYAGMALRDWFAGQALAGLLTHPASRENWRESVVTEAYAMADSMLAARAEGRS